MIDEDLDGHKLLLFLKIIANKIFYMQDFLYVNYALKPPLGQ